MIKLSKSIFSRTLLLLICLAPFCFLPGCGGSSGGGDGEEVTYTLTITTTPAVDSFHAGETVTITATVTGSDGLAASGQAVTFTVFRNNSGGTLTIVGTGTTDGNGEAQATYMLGSDNSGEAVADTIEISIPGSSETITINREAETYSLVVSSDATNLSAGDVATITATVTDSSGDPASGQAVTFEISTNSSGGTLTIAGTGTTDANGQAQAYYTAGTTSPDVQVQDTIEVSVLSVTKSVTITRVVGTTEQAASLDLAASPTSIKTDNSNTSTITVNALSAGNAILTGVTVNLSTDTGVLSAPSVTTPGTVTLSCGGSNKANRTATITATTGTIAPQQIPVQIVGSTVSVSADASSISTAGSTIITALVKDAGGNVVSGATVNLSQSGTGTLTFGSDTGTTNVSGQFTTTASGHTNGTVTISVTALGATGTVNLTVTDVATVFYIDQQRLCSGAYPGSCVIISNNPNPTAMQLTDTLEIRVNAPAPMANVRFASSQGTFTDPTNAANTGSVITVAVDASNKATAYFTTTQAGMASVNVSNAADLATNDTLTVAMTSAHAYSITLQAAPNIVARSVDTTTGLSTLTAMVRDSGGAPVGNALVAFSIVPGTSTGGGETILNPTAQTASTTAGGRHLGEATATFKSGSLPSGQSSASVKVRASVVGATYDYDSNPLTAESPVQTELVDLTPNGPDASITIGGVAGSIAFGMATALGKDESNANYTLDMSALVADAAGNPVPEGTVVTLSLWPVAWSTGSGCSYDEDDDTDYALVDDDNDPLTPSTDDDGILGTDPKVTMGTFWNEDINENLILDPGEDVIRIFYDTSYAATHPEPHQIAPTVDGLITPINSRAGTVPSPVLTDKNGVAKFTLTYPITSSIWTVVRLRASTYVQGTETVGQVVWRLAPRADDVSPCHITGSPYQY